MEVGLRLRDALERDMKLLALEMEDPESILGVLEECRGGLVELRGVLLREREWSSLEGL